MHSIKKVEYLEKYKLKLHFENKSIKIVDLEEMLKKAKNMFIPLLNIDYFKKVKCDGTTLYWPNGVDLCPDVLYKMGKNFKASNPTGIKRLNHTRKKTKIKAK